jgi:ferredoxin-NADP reductase
MIFADIVPNKNSVEYQTLIIQQIREEAPGFKVIIFRDGHQLTWREGQYLTFIHQFQGEEIRRSYSIISSSALGEPLAIGFRRIQNGIFSRYLADRLQPGDSLQTIGAAGFFTLPDNCSPYHDLVFFAAGSGISPIISLIKSALYGQPHLHVLLLYSTPAPEQTPFLQELIQLEKKFSNRFEIRFYFSNTVQLSKARLNRESLVVFLSGFTPERFSKTLFYICGPDAYMRMCTYSLQESRVPAENIRKEIFNTVRVRTPFMPPDLSPRKVIIHQEGKIHIVTVAYPDTILSASKKKVLQLPYSCETGRCGNCAMRLISGNVWMSNNEVLTERELEDGLILTCVGHPVFGDAELDIK